MKVFDENGRLTVNTGDFSLFGSVSAFTVEEGLTLYFGDADSNLRIKNGKLQIGIGVLYYSLIGQLVNGEPVLSLGDSES